MKRKLAYDFPNDPFPRLKSRIWSTRSMRILKSKIKPFLKGDDVEVTRQTIDFIKVFLEWKEHRAIRGGHSNEFDGKERTSLHHAFSWLIRVIWTCETRGFGTKT